VAYLLLVLGLIFLVAGGDFLVKGAVSIALKAKISPLVVGMTVVSIGTSAPELLVSLRSVLEGHPDVAVGAVVGSNIANLALVLGFTLLIFPISVNKDSIKIDWPVMFLASISFYFFAQDEVILWWEGLIFLTLLILFILGITYRSRKKNLLSISQQTEDIPVNSSKHPLWKALFFIFIGALGLYQGADWLIRAVVQIAEKFEISEKVISVSIVAFGTSVPELATSLVAAFKKETDISVGNLIGSNLFNIFAILGITAIVHPIEISPFINAFDIYVMLGVALILLPMMLIRQKMNFVSGIILLSIYGLYIYFSFLYEI